MNIKRIEEYYDSPEYLKKLQSRAENVRLCAADPMARGRMILDVYAVDFERFCEDFLFLILPEYGDKIKPFFLFDYQKEIIHKIENAELSYDNMELLVDKPRGMGITWLIVAYFYWRWLFTPNWTAFILSRTETEVDDGTASPSNSIFGKLRWLIKHTSKFLVPEGFEAKGKKGTSTDSTLRIINPVMGSAIMGSSTNANAGRSRRYSVVLIDECFSIEHFNDVWKALQSVARILIFVSTTKAGINYKRFKDMCEKAGNYVSLTWRDHPFKDEEWYEEQKLKAEFDPEVMKEIDVSYAISVASQYYPQVAQSILAPARYEPNLPLYVGLDFGKNDFTVIVWVQFSGNNIRVLECYSNNQRPPIWFAPFLNPELELTDGGANYTPEPLKEPERVFTYSPKQIELMARVRGWKKPMGYFGEVAHMQKSTADHRSVADILGRKGIRIIANNYAIEHEPRRHATSSLLPRTVFNDESEGALNLYDAIMNSRYKKAGSSEAVSMQPVHDEEIADYRSAFENLCVNIGRIFKHQRRETQEGEVKQNNFAANLIKYLRV